MRKSTPARHAWALLVIAGIAFPGCGETGDQPEVTSQGELEQFLRDNPEYAAPEEASRNPNADEQTLGL